MGTIDIFNLVLNTFELVACVTGFVRFKKLRDNHWKWFPFYLIFILAGEFTGRYFREHKMDEVCKNFYNYFEIPIEFLFFFWLFHREFRKQKNKNVPIICGLAYLACWLVDSFYISTMNFWFYSFSYTCGNMLLLVVVLTYFTRLITSDAILNYKSDALFWVSTGLLLFYLGTFPYYGLRNTLVYNYEQLYITYSYIMYILNSAMYIMFILGLIYGKPQKNVVITGSLS